MSTFISNLTDIISDKFHPRNCDNCKYPLEYEKLEGNLLL